MREKKITLQINYENISRTNNLNMNNTKKWLWVEGGCSYDFKIINSFTNPGGLSRDTLSEVIALINAEAERVIDITK